VKLFFGHGALNERRNMPKVSVVIPTYDRAHFLDDAIRSVLAQTFDDFELIIVDDGSTDNTREVVNSFEDSRIKYIYQENRGVSAAYNSGILASSSEFIAFLDSDDLWLPQKLELQVKLLDSRPDVALVCSDGYIFDNRTNSTLGRFWRGVPFGYRVDPQRASREPLKEMLFWGCFITESLVMVRREVFNEVGGYDESLRDHVDWDMYVRVCQRFAIETIDTPLAKKRKHEANLSSNFDLLYKGAEIVLNKAIHSYSLKPDELSILRRRLARTLFRYGRGLVERGRIAQGRKKLLASIKVNPWPIIPYIWLMGSFLGSRLILLGGRLVLILRSWKKWLKRNITRSQPSGDTMSI
jgi:glycosyltransferase involved in cell wall biosynthesis